MSNITVMTLNKFRKRARGLLRSRISSTFILIMYRALKVRETYIGGSEGMFPREKYV